MSDNLEVLAATLTVAAGLGYTTRAERLFRRGDDGWYVRVLPDGQPAVVLVHPDRGTVVRVVPQRRYGKTSDYRSISFPQIPDIAVEIEPPVGPPAILLFDPKYKLDSDGDSDGEGDRPGDGGPQKGDIDKMHAYRDAIRDVAGQRVVTYAAILYPGRASHQYGEVAALSAVPGDSGALAQQVAAALGATLRALPPDGG